MKRPAKRRPQDGKLAVRRNPSDAVGLVLIAVVGYVAYKALKPWWGVTC